MMTKLRMLLECECFASHIRIAANSLLYDEARKAPKWLRSSRSVEGRIIAEEHSSTEWNRRWLQAACPFATMRHL